MIKIQERARQALMIRPWLYEIKYCMRYYPEACKKYYKKFIRREKNTLEIRCSGCEYPYSEYLTEVELQTKESIYFCDVCFEPLKILFTEGAP